MKVLDISIKIENHFVRGTFFLKKTGPQNNTSVDGKKRLKKPENIHLEQKTPNALSACN